MNVEVLVLQPLKPQIPSYGNCIRNRLHPLRLLQLPLIMDRPRSCSTQQDYSLVCRTTRDGLTSMPFLLTQIVRLLLFGIFGALHRPFCAVEDNLFDLRKTLDKLLNAVQLVLWQSLLVAQSLLQHRQQSVNPAPLHRLGQSRTARPSSRRWGSICSRTGCRTACLGQYSGSPCVQHLFPNKSNIISRYISKW